MLINNAYAVYEEKVYVTSYVIVNYIICLYLHHRL